jgi:antitoxin component YwqK of YwqJK toxin-antitoxin module
VIFKGEFWDGVRNGAGIEYDSTGVPITEGAWTSDKLCGFATKYFQDGKKKFEGNFSDGIKDGFGISFHLTGQKKYEGDWKEDKYRYSPEEFN